LIAREEAEEKDRKDKLRTAADMHRAQLAEFRDRMHAERLEQIKQGERHKKLSAEAARGLSFRCPSYPISIISYLWICYGVAG
jgi:hypothetical protein